MCRNTFVLMGLLVGFGLAGCTLLEPTLTPKLDTASATAKAETPPAAVVETISIPANPAASTGVFVIENFAVAASGVTSGNGAVPGQPTPRRWITGPAAGGQTGGFDQSPNANILGPVTDLNPAIGQGLASQLATTLGPVGNVQTVNADVYRQNGGRLNLVRPQVGPFLIKGTVTEFNETTEAEDEGRRFDLNSAAGITKGVGQLLRIRSLDAAGNIGQSAGVGAEKTALKRTGMVVVDIQIVDPVSGLNLTSFRSTGTFTTITKTSAWSALGAGSGSAEYAASALGQATRAAMNDAAKQIHSFAISQGQVAVSGQ